MTTRVFTTALYPGGAAVSVTPEILRAIYTELHNELLASGLVQTADIGQIDIATHAFPTASSSSSWYGYKIYSLNDGLSPSVYIKIRYGLAASANSPGRVPVRIGVSVGFSTDGAGNLIGGTTEREQGGYTSSYMNYRSDYSTYQSSSYICKADGFYGIIYKTNAINPSTAGPSGSTNDAPCLFAFFVCRTTDDSGQFTEDGVSVVFGGAARTINYFGGPLIVTHLSFGGVEITTERACLALGADAVTAIGGNLPIYSIYAMTPTPRRIMQLGSVARVSGSATDEVSIALKGTTPRNYLVNHACWPGDAFGGAAAKACIAMLWE